MATFGDPVENTGRAPPQATGAFSGAPGVFGSTAPTFTSSPAMTMANAGNDGDMLNILQMFIRELASQNRKLEDFTIKPNGTVSIRGEEQDFTLTELTLEESVDSIKNVQRYLKELAYFGIPYAKIGNIPVIEFTYMQLNHINATPLITGLVNLFDQEVEAEEANRQISAFLAMGDGPRIWPTGFSQELMKRIIDYRWAFRYYPSTLRMIKDTGTLSNEQKVNATNEIITRAGKALELCKKLKETLDAVLQQDTSYLSIVTGGIQAMVSANNQIKGVGMKKLENYFQGNASSANGMVLKAIKDSKEASLLTTDAWRGTTQSKSEVVAESAGGNAWKGDRDMLVHMVSAATTFSAVEHMSRFLAVVGRISARMVLGASAVDSDKFAQQCAILSQQLHAAKAELIQMAPEHAEAVQNANAAELRNAQLEAFLSQAETEHRALQAKLANVIQTLKQETFDKDALSKTLANMEQTVDAQNNDAQERMATFKKQADAEMGRLAMEGARRENASRDALRELASEKQAREALQREVIELRTQQQTQLNDEVLSSRMLSGATFTSDLEKAISGGGIKRGRTKAAPKATGETVGAAICATCGGADNVRACVGCETVHYCSEECQADDWQQHETTCSV
jgi:hypothetical protein